MVALGGSQVLVAVIFHTQLGPLGEHQVLAIISAHMRTKLDPWHVEQYARAGYCVVDDLLSPEELGEWCGHTTGRYDMSFCANVRLDSRAFF
jgi:hypothetical protein